MKIKETALKLGEQIYGTKFYAGYPSGNRLIDFAEALVAELAKENKPVATKLETMQFDCFQVSVDDAKRLRELPTGTKLYTLPPTAEQIEQETAEACAKVCKALADCDENTEPYRQGASWCEEVIRSGAWKEYK